MLLYENEKKNTLLICRDVPYIGGGGKEPPGWRLHRDGLKMKKVDVENKTQIKQCHNYTLKGNKFPRLGL